MYILLNYDVILDRVWINVNKVICTIKSKLNSRKLFL